MKQTTFIGFYNLDTLEFWTDLKEKLTGWIDLNLVEEDKKIDLDNYQAALASTPLTLSIPFLLVDTTQPTWSIFKAIAQFKNSLTETFFLDKLPLRATIFDYTGAVKYTNHQSDGSFSFPDDPVEPLDTWIMDEIKTSPNQVFHLPLAIESFDRTIVQTYQGLYDSNGKFYGVFQYTQNIKPLLASYLTDSGQALVGWSDVVSGASISNDL